MKKTENQRHAPREPRQERSRHKVGLILEATIRLIERDGVEALTTNAIAASAGVSIGTLYQFFPNKEAILDTLCARETAKISESVMQVMQDATITTTEARVVAMVHAVAASYGARHTAHGQVMAYSLTQNGRLLSPLLAKLTAHLMHDRQQGSIRGAIPGVDVFVLAHALVGVLRAMTLEHDSAPPQDDIAKSLSRLVVGFIQPA